MAVPHKCGSVSFPPKADVRHFPIESGSGLLWTRCPLRSIALGNVPGNAEGLKFLPPSQLGRLKLLARDLFPESPSFAAQRPATAFATAIPLAVILEGGTARAVVPNYQAKAWSYDISHLLKLLMQSHSQRHKASTHVAGSLF